MPPRRALAALRAISFQPGLNSQNHGYSHPESRLSANIFSMSPHPPFTDVPTALKEIRAARMVVVVDDEDRENEGDLTLAAERVTPEAINFMAKFGRGLICVAMTDDGTMVRVPDLIHFCAQHDLKMLTVAELIRYRMQNERYVHRVAEAIIPTQFGDWRLIAYQSDTDGESHVALVKGALLGDAAPKLVRVHSHCLVGDVFGTTLCDCRAVMDRSMQMIAEAGSGAVVYLHQTGRGFGVEKIEDRNVLFFHREIREHAAKESSAECQR